MNEKIEDFKTALNRSKERGILLSYACKDWLKALKMNEIDLSSTPLNELYKYNDVMMTYSEEVIHAMSDFARELAHIPKIGNVYFENEYDMDIKSYKFVRNEIEHNYGPGREIDGAFFIIQATRGIQVNTESMYGNVTPIKCPKIDLMTEQLEKYYFDYNRDPIRFSRLTQELMK